MSNTWDLMTNVQSDGEERANIHKLRCGTFPYNSPRKLVRFFPFYRKERGSERCSDWPNVTSLTNGKSQDPNPSEFIAHVLPFRGAQRGNWRSKVRLPGGGDI